MPFVSSASSDYKWQVRIFFFGSSECYFQYRILQNYKKAFHYRRSQSAGTVEPLLYDHPQNHIGVVV